MDDAYSPDHFEPAILEKWRRLPVEHSMKGSPFSMVMPPPNVTGVLHMGHALVSSIQDLVARWRSMNGDDLLWIPGTDHAGIATQTVVERRSIALYGKRRIDYSREEFLTLTHAWKDEHEEKICSQLSRLGLLCAWDKKRFTMDSIASKAVTTLFHNLFTDGLIYKGDYLVNWDPVTETALADDEVEYEEQEGFLYYVRYPLEDGNFLVVATTRPETIPADVALAVNPSDPRYKALIGSFALHPISGQKLPIIGDIAVEAAFGTGVLKVTPGHDIIDYEIGQRHNLPMISMMDPNGTINEKGAPFTGLSMAEGREAATLLLESTGRLEKKLPHTRRVGTSYRSKAVIEPYLSKQWFIRMEPFKAALRKAVEEKQVELIPASWERTYFHWIDNLRDWCISRQLWWGHRIPVWSRIDNPSIMLSSADGVAPKEVKEAPDEWVQDPDVLDTWFSSALWPFSTLGWPEKSSELSHFYPNALLVTGHDILFFWVARMIMMGQYAMGKVPFKKVFLHGLIYSRSYWRNNPKGGITYLSRDERKVIASSNEVPKDVHSRFEKMSKSKGNVIDPLEVIAEVGTDALRMTLISLASDARALDLDERRFSEQKHFMNKIWNAARFTLSHLPEGEKLTFSQQDLAIDDHWILSEFEKTAAKVDEALTAFQFHEATQILYHFFWDEFCAYYIESSKRFFAAKDQKAKSRAAITSSLFVHILALFHPFIPFITEELMDRFKEKLHLFGDHPLILSAKALLEAPALQKAPFPKALKLSLDMQGSLAVEKIKEITYAIRKMRGELKVPLGTLTELKVSFDKESASPLSEDEEAILRQWARVGTIHYNLQSDESTDISASVGKFTLSLLLGEGERERRLDFIVKEVAKLEGNIAHLKARLENQDFVSKAPAHLVIDQKEKLLQLEKSLETLQKERESLLHKRAKKG